MLALSTSPVGKSTIFVRQFFTLLKASDQFYECLSIHILISHISPNSIGVIPISMEDKFLGEIGLPRNGMSTLPLGMWIMENVTCKLLLALSLPE